MPRTSRRGRNATTSARSRRASRRATRASSARRPSSRTRPGGNIVRRSLPRPEGERYQRTNAAKIFENGPRTDAAKIFENGPRLAELGRRRYALADARADDFANATDAFLDALAWAVYPNVTAPSRCLGGTKTSIRLQDAWAVPKRPYVFKMPVRYPNAPTSSRCGDLRGGRADRPQGRPRTPTERLGTPRRRWRTLAAAGAARRRAGRSSNSQNGAPRLRRPSSRASTS